MEFNRDHDERVRGVAFEWLAEQISIHGDVLPRTLLAEGLLLGENRVRFVGPQGIFKPAVMQIPLSITSAPGGPYDDAIGQDNLLRYKYRGRDPNHRDNVSLRVALQNSLPLVYFHGIVPDLRQGRYMTMWPVYAVNDSPTDLEFSFALDEAIHADLFSQPRQGTAEIVAIRREYTMSVARQRLHQRVFRERVLKAYRHQCAFCRLRHSELLDAAHIIPDSEPEGEPVVSNGLALCRLHHAAFDRFFLGVSPDRIIQVRPDILGESDGPTLRHALQGLHGIRIILPISARDQPDVAFLARRYDRFLAVSGSQ